MAKITIVISTLNEEQYIKKLLVDILNSSYKNYEIIVSDNGSSDNTIMKVKSIKDWKKKIKIVQSKKKGPSCVRNYGARNLKSEYILFLDADSRMDSFFLENSIIEMEKRKLDIASYYIYSVNKRLFENIFIFFSNIISNIMQYITPISSAGILIKTKIHNKIKGFDENITTVTENLDYLRRASKFGKFRIIKSSKDEFCFRRFQQEGKIKTAKKWVLGLFFHLLKIDLNKFPYEYKFGGFKNP